MNGETRRAPAGPLIGGILLVLVGVLFTLDSFGVLKAGDLLDYWPLVLVGAGLARIVGPRRPQERVGGVILTMAGGLLLLRTLHLFWFRLHDLWPVLFLLGGGALLWQALRRKPAFSAGGEMGARAMEGMGEGSACRTGDPRDAGSLLQEFAFMGGGDRVVRSQDFRGGKVDAILGGFKIDLRGAGMAGDSAAIDVFAFWGGIELRVPESWNVVLHGMPILGAFVNRTHPGIGEAPAKTLLIRGAVVMGGIEVKN